jgi:hypothetical protein
MIKYTRHNLKKLETLFKELDYTIRYEKGTFQSGYAIVEQRKIAVINKFFDTEARINVLIDILFTLDLSEVELSEPSAKLLKALHQEMAEEEE